jgi:membrane-associated phospholipid phosphatase
MIGQIISRNRTETGERVAENSNHRFSLLLSILLITAALAVVPWDNALIEVLRNTSPASDSLLNDFKVFSWYFKGFGKGNITVLLALVFGLCGYKQRAVAVICALIISGLLVWPLKVTIHRERPRGNSYVSFPSGDAASAASFAQVAVSGAPILIPFAAVTAASVSAGRVFGFAHYPSDVLAGSALGIIAGILGLKLSKRYTFKLRERYFFLLFVLYASGNSIICAVSKTQNELSHFLDVFGPLIFLIVAGRLVFQMARRRTRHANGIPQTLEQAGQIQAVEF